MKKQQKNGTMLAQKKTSAKPAAKTRSKGSKKAPTKLVKEHGDAGKVALAKVRANLKHRDIELKIYRELGRAAVSATDLTKIFDRLMGYVLKALDADSGTIYLVDECTDELVFEVVKGPGSKDLKGKRLPVGAGIAGEVARSGKAFVSSDLSSEKQWLGKKATYKAENMMAVPIKEKKKVIGVIAVINKSDEEPFTEENLKALKSLSSHFSIVMETRALFTELDRKVGQSRTLQEIGSLLVSTLDEKVVRKRAIEAITGLVHAEVGSLLMVDSLRKELFFEVALGEKGEKLKEVRLKIGEGIAGWVASTGKSVIIHDVTTDKRFLTRVDKKSTFKTKSVLCVPVVVKGTVIGVLQAVNKLKGRFTDDDKDLILLFANQVGIALDNARLYRELREAFYATSESLAEAIEKRDPYTGGHTKRVLGFSLAIGRELKMSTDELENLKLAAVLHDIGKIGIDDDILRKNGRLDDEERALMEQHTKIGADILAYVPQLMDIVPGIYYHHERMDGKGYPTGVKKAKIPLMARIIAVADTFDAMTTTRPYRSGLSTEVAMAELERCSGTQFDTKVVKAFIEAYISGEAEKLADMSSILDTMNIDADSVL